MKSNVEKGTPLYFSDGQILFYEGDEWDGLYLIRHGVVDIYRERNGKKIELNKLQEGEFIGIATMVTRSPRLATARAVGKCHVQKFEPEQTDAMLKSMPLWGRAAIKEMIRNLDRADQELVHLRLHPPKPKELVGYLPIYELLMFFNGLCWNEYLPKWETSNELKNVMPVKNVGSWLEGVINQPAEKIDEAFDLLVEYKVVKTMECGRYGRCVENPDRALYQTLAEKIKQANTISIKEAHSILDDESIKDERRIDAIATVLKHLSVGKAQD